MIGFGTSKTAVVLELPKCFWYSMSEKLLTDGSGINLFYDFKKDQGEVPKTYMFGVKVYVITKNSHVKTILDNSPNPFGPGKLKYRFFKSFMKDNVGVSEGCPWKHRRILNEKVLDTNKLHLFSEKYNKDIAKFEDLEAKRKTLHKNSENIYKQE